MTALGFFQPVYLWALAALAVPLIIHLFMRRKTVRLDFSTTRFLQETAVQAARRRRLADLLLLVTRLILVAVVVLIFSRPFDTATPFALLRDPNLTLSVWIDPTVSMQYREGVLSLTDRAWRLVDVADSLLAPGARLRVWDPSRQEFVARDAFRRDESSIFVPTDIARMWQALRREYAGNPAPHAVVLFSDFQRSDSAQTAVLLADTTVPLPRMFVSLAPPRVRNAGIVDARFSAGDRGMLRCSVVCAEEPLTGECAVLADGMRVGSTVLQLAANAGVTVPLNINLPPSSAGARIQLLVQDAFDVDNESHVASSQDRTLHILVVSDDPASFALVSALRTLPSPQGVLVVSTPVQHLTAPMLDSAQVIVFSSLRRVSTLIQQFVRSSAWGTKLVVFAPPSSNADDQFSALVWDRLQARTRLVSVDRPQHAVLPDTMAALWQGFPRIAEAGVSVSSFRTGLPGAVLCRLSGGEPLISQLREPDGRVWLISATPLQVDSANNLCETGFYLPLLDRCIRHGLQAVQPEPARFFAGRPHANPLWERGVRAQLVDAQGTLCAHWDRQAQVVIDRPGLYTVRPQGGTPFALAVNVDPAELTLVYRQPQPGQNLRQRIASLDGTQFEPFLRRHCRQGTAGVLWIFLGLCVLAEALLSFSIGQRRGAP